MYENKFLDFLNSNSVIGRYDNNAYIESNKSTCILISSDSNLAINETLSFEFLEKMPKKYSIDNKINLSTKIYFYVLDFEAYSKEIINVEMKEKFEELDLESIGKKRHNSVLFDCVQTYILFFMKHIKLLDNEKYSPFLNRIKINFEYRNADLFDIVFDEDIDFDDKTVKFMARLVFNEVYKFMSIDSIFNFIKYVYMKIDNFDISKENKNKFKNIIFTNIFCKTLCYKDFISSGIDYFIQSIKYSNFFFNLFKERLKTIIRYEDLTKKSGFIILNRTNMHNLKKDFEDFSIYFISVIDEDENRIKEIINILFNYNIQKYYNSTQLYLLMNFPKLINKEKIDDSILLSSLFDNFFLLSKYKEIIVNEYGIEENMLKFLYYFDDKSETGLKNYNLMMIQVMDSKYFDKFKNYMAESIFKIAFEDDDEYYYSMVEDETYVILNEERLKEFFNLIVMSARKFGYLNDLKIKEQIKEQFYDFRNCFPENMQKIVDEAFFNCPDKEIKKFFIDKLI